MLIPSIEHIYMEVLQLVFHSSVTGVNLMAISNPATVPLGIHEAPV